MLLLFAAAMLSPEAAVTPPAPAPAVAAAKWTELAALSPQGHRMAGELLLPADARGDAPVVMLISGTGRQSRDFSGFDGRYRPHDDLAQALLSAGVGVVRFDERNTGLSTGDHKVARSLDLQADAQLILHRAAEQPGVDRRRVYVFGHSEGAVFAMRLAATDPLVAGIAVAGAPALSGREMMRGQVRIETPRKPGQTNAEWEAAVAEAYAKDIAFMESRPSLADLLDYDGEAAARAVTKPALILESMEDWQVTPPQGRRLAEAMRSAGNVQVDYVALPEVGHLLTPNPPGVTDYSKLTDYSVAPALKRALVDWVRARS
ncbi:alpha/beta hydrolase family protein [Sphingomonas lenta]|uniref:AB hydrolase-1 domain-containing protein n=1 Tax=Sphingomonas lenta TaxID=1141887 RepID=A0A2A2SF33_9SPHN|nr:alpha/beta fold hydrolase [Sphingomonas lenta]PAX07813.1 hypothetical protein CKY28_09295 [Sphingomonas lenta]